MWLERMLAKPLARDNESRPAALRERLDDVRPLMMLRLVAAVASVMVALVTFAGLQPLHIHVAVILQASVIATALEIAMVAWAKSVAALDRWLTAFAFVYVTFAAALFHTSTDAMWLGPLLFALVLAGSGTVLGARSLAAVTVYASLSFTTVLLGQIAGLIPYGTLFVGNEDIALAGVLTNEPELIAAAVVFVAGFGFPAIATVTYATTRRLRSARHHVQVTASDLNVAQALLTESRDQLRSWNEQLNEQVARKTRDLETQNRHLAAINAVSFALSGPMDEEDATERAARLIARVLNVRATQLYVLPSADLPAERLVIAAEAEPRRPVQGLAETLMWRVARDGVPTSYPADPIIAGESESLGGEHVPEGTDAFAIVPLVAKGRTIGSLAALGERPDGWDQQELRMLVLIGREFGVALENARLYRAALDTGAQEALLSEVVRALDAGDVGDTGRALTLALEIVTVRIGARFAAVVARPEGSRQPLVLAQHSSEPAHGERDAAMSSALLAAPALVGDRTDTLILGDGGEEGISAELAAEGVGTLVLVPVVGARVETAAGDGARAAGTAPSATGRHITLATLVVAADAEAAWGQRHFDLFTRLAGVMARRLETDGLLKLQTRRINELAGLAAVAATMRSTIDPERLYSGFARAVHKLVDYRYLYVARLDDTGELTHVERFGGGGRALPPPAFDPVDSTHSWFDGRTLAWWSAGEAPAPSFIGADDQHALVVPLRPKGQVLGVVVLTTVEPLADDHGALVGQAAEQLALALDSAALYRQATERAARIQVMSNLAALVASVVDLREAFDAFAEEVRWLIPFDRAVIMLIDEAEGTVEPYATYPEEHAAHAETAPLAGSLAAAAVESGGPVALTRADPRHAHLDWSPFGPDVQEVAVVPVTSGGVCTAVFALAHLDVQGYTVEEFTALEEVSRLLGVTIDRLRLFEQSEHNARHDQLTGLPNLRYLNERLEELRTGLEEGSRCAVLVIDMDDLKLFNDTLGHEVGDRVLQVLARELRDSCRSEDFVARVGGDEFVVVMEHGDLETARAVAERLHEVLTDAHTTIEGAPPRIRVSVGIAVAPEDGTDARQLLAAADEAMYEAKFAGGRRTRVAAGRHSDPAVRTLRSRSNRVVETMMRGVTAGASEQERAALSLAERYAASLALSLDVPDTAIGPLRMLVAAEASGRLLERHDDPDQQLAATLLDGWRAAWARREPQGAATCTAAAQTAVELAWLEAAPPAGAGLPLDQALSHLRSEPPGDVSEAIIANMEQVARAEAVERRRSTTAA